jgi:glycosyltransferase involved in cell wall biosynthesis
MDGNRVRYVGEADAVMKRELYRNASALLMPITWEEPFGLVMAEAQACGTPVICFRRGAAPEIVCDGETGFVVETTDEMVAAVHRTGEIEPSACRENVERRFDSPAMAANYLEVYRRILDAERPGICDATAALTAGLQQREPSGSTTVRVA